MAKIVLGRSGLQICVYLVMGTISNEVRGDLSTFEVVDD
jgi:hypothetical protein